MVGVGAPMGFAPESCHYSITGTCCNKINHYWMWKGVRACQILPAISDFESTGKKTHLQVTQNPNCDFEESIMSCVIG